VQRYSSRVACLDADEVEDGHWRLCIGGSEDKDVGGLDDRHLAELVRRNMRANNVYVSTFDHRSVITPDHLDLRTNWIYSELSSFYRAMHFSAKRGIAIACRLSVCLSVRL